MIQPSETCVLIQSLIGQAEYAKLLGMLPDDFYFKLSNDEKETAMKAVKHELLHEGEKNLPKLKEIVENYTRVILEGATV